MSTELHTTNPNRISKLVPRKFAEITGAAALSAVVLSGCESSALPEPSENYTTHEVVSGDTLGDITKSALETCETPYDDTDIKDGNTALMGYNDKSSPDVTAGMERINIPDNFCEIVHLDQ